MANTVVIEALRNSKKGRLHYDRNWKEEGRTKQLLDEISIGIVSLNVSPKSLEIIRNSDTSDSNNEEDKKPLSKTSTDSSSNMSDIDSDNYIADIINNDDNFNYTKKLSETVLPIMEYENERLLTVQLLHDKKKQEYETFSLNLLHKFQCLYEKWKNEKNETKTPDSNGPEKDKNYTVQRGGHMKIADKSNEQINEVSNESPNKTDFEKMRLQEQFILKQKVAASHKHLIIDIVNEIKEKLDSYPDKSHLQNECHESVRKLNAITEKISKVVNNAETQDITANEVTSVEQLVEQAEELGRSICLDIDERSVSFADQAKLKLREESSVVSLLPDQLPLHSEVKDDKNSPQCTEEEMDHSSHHVEAEVTSDPPLDSNDNKTISAEVPVENSTESVPEGMEECDDSVADALKKQQKNTSPKTSQKSELAREFSTLQEYLSTLEYLTTVENSIRSFATDPKLKKYKLELHKAVTTPINAISSCTGTHLRDKMNRLISLLSGQMVSCGGKYTSCQNDPNALAYCKKLIAEKIVSQGEEQVASQFETSFPYAAVTVAICSKFPDMWTLILGQFYRRCPYLVPFYPPREEGQSDTDYYMSLGYKYIDDKLEEKDKFLKRMSGFMRLYAAIIYTTSTSGVSSPNLHGLARGWTWVAQTLNASPRPDITATLLFDFLDVLGHLIERTYGKQFTKILHILCKDFFQNVKAMASSGSAGPISRLENFLQSSIKRGGIAPPSGILPSRFWQT